MSIITECEVCNDLGYLYSINEAFEDEVQKCDTCNIYLNDQQAQEIGDLIFEEFTSTEYAKFIYFSSYDFKDVRKDLTNGRLINATDAYKKQVYSKVSKLVEENNGKFI